MSTVRARCGVLVAGLGLAVLAACPGAASASFSTRVAATATATTLTVAAPAAPSTAGSTACALGQTGYTVRVSWTGSTTPRVNAYRLTETVNSVARAPVTMAGTTFTRAATKGFLTTATHSFAVVAVTDYGWTSVPATVGYTC